MARIPVAALALLLALPLGGCLEAYNDYEDFDTDSPYRNVGVFEGSYIMGGGGSMVLLPGALRQAMRPEIVTLESERPAYGALAPALGLATGAMTEGGDGSRVDIRMAIWRPDNYTVPTPIIVDAGPYYEQGNSTLEMPDQSTPRLVQNMLPRGYTVVQLAVRGTGSAGGCMDLFGPDETADLDQALRWLGEQPWSNGRIGLIGVSYDGSTPWTAAGTGNPYVKTIVPISGLPDIYDLMMHNGSAETRAAVMHGTSSIPGQGVYWGYGFSKDFPAGLVEDTVVGFPWPVPPPSLGSANGRASHQDLQNLLCPEAVEGQAAGRLTAAEGSRLAAATAYWTERDHRDDVLANYDGSVFLIHGLQDWNVDPHSAIPFNTALRAKGLEVKEWYGQWDHAWPDSNCAPGAPGWAVVPCRMDFGEVLARWFDKHLMGYPSLLNSLMALDPADHEDEDTQEAIRAAQAAFASAPDSDRQAAFELARAELERAFGDLLDTGPSVQVQDDLGLWRNAEAFPPTAPDWRAFPLGADGALGKAVSGQTVLKASAAPLQTNVAQFVTEPFPDGLHVSGLPQVKVPFSVSSEGGFLAAWLFDVDPNGRVRSPAVVQVEVGDSGIRTWQPAGIPIVGHAQLNLRYHAGGETPQPLVPGQRYVAQVEFEPLEVHVPDGHRLMLWLFQYPYPEHSRSTVPADVTVYFDEGAQLLLPTVEIDPRTVFPVPGVSFPNATVVPEMYIRMPTLPGVSTGGQQHAAPSQPMAADAPQAQPAQPGGPADRLRLAAKPCLPGCAG